MDPNIDTRKQWASVLYLLHLRNTSFTQRKKDEERGKNVGGEGGGGELDTNKTRSKKVWASSNIFLREFHPLTFPNLTTTDCFSFLFGWKTIFRSVFYVMKYDRIF